MRLRIVALGGLAASLMLGAQAAEVALKTGVYEIEVRVSLPNVQDTAPPLRLTRCVSSADLQTGQAFFVLSDNPLKTCDLLDYEVGAAQVVYRIACAGPNRGSAVALFEIGSTSYRGTIAMNMGGKNMTMSETQIGKRIGDCPQ